MSSSQRQWTQTWRHWLCYSSWLGSFIRSLIASKLACKLRKKWQTSRLSRFVIGSRISRYNINVTENQYEQSKYKSLHEFAIRKLKKEARTVDKTPHSLCSPVDGTAFVIPYIGSTTCLYGAQHPFSLAAFIGCPDKAQLYNNGSMILLRMAEYGYHRFHSPVAGYVKQHKRIEGGTESLEPATYASLLPLLTNTRTPFTLTTASGQQVILVAVNGDITGNPETTYNPRTNYLLKATELGYFAAGTPAIALIAQPGALALRNDLLEHSLNGSETIVKMGESIARWTQPSTLDTHHRNKTLLRQQ